jgi:predicted nuclease of restriction endonuclease-like (RecB) superfamily
MNEITNHSLFEQIKNIIEETKNNVAVAVNSSLTIMYWHIGKLINDEILQNKRAEYGKEIIVTLSRQLQDNFGKGYDEKNLRRMMQFAKNIDEKNIVTLSQQLSWSHFKELIVLEDTLKIEFYTQMSIAQNWGVRTLGERIDFMLYERTALSKYEKEEEENEPLGIILCADKKEEQIELLELEKSGIHVAQYLTVLPPREILEAKLHQAIENAKAKYMIELNK